MQPFSEQRDHSKHARGQTDVFANQPVREKWKHGHKGLSL